jgi:hypothetical protein
LFQINKIASQITIFHYICSLQKIQQQKWIRILTQKKRKQNGSSTGKKIKRFTEKRNNKINTEMHKATKYILDYCIEYDISKVVIGYNPSWKQDINLGKKNKPEFH